MIIYKYISPIVVWLGLEGVSALWFALDESMCCLEQKFFFVVQGSIIRTVFYNDLLLFVYITHASVTFYNSYRISF